MASRILGMGDVLTLIEKAEQSYDAKKAQETAEKLLQNRFTLNDYLDQMDQLKNMGDLGDLMAMVPGVDAKALKGAQLDEKDYLAFDCHSGGVIQYFTHGRMVPGIWLRDIKQAHNGNVDMCPIRYYDLEGNELEINNGKTFICVIQDTDIQNVTIRE